MKEQTSNRQQATGYKNMKQTQNDEKDNTTRKTGIAILRNYTAKTRLILECLLIRIIKHKYIPSVCKSS